MKLAVIGLGSAGARHARLLRDAGHHVRGYDPARPDSARSLEEAFDGAQAVVVASPSSLHADHAAAAVAAGLPVLVEKPVATDVEAAEQVASAAERGGVLAAAAMNLRFHPALVELKRLVTNGNLGDIRQARASFGFDLSRWRPESDYRQSYSARAELGGGIVFDAIHELDYLRWLLGPAESVIAETARVSALEIDVEDTALAAVRFRSGPLVSVDLNFHEPVYRRSCVLIGSEAVAEWSWTGETIIVRAAYGSEQLLPVPCDVSDTYQAELNDFVAAVENRGTPRASYRDGIEALRLAQALKQSAANGRRTSL